MSSTLIVRTWCYFHGVEEVESPAVHCNECGHLWETLTAFRTASDAARGRVGAPVLMNIQDETVCPLCTHDL